MPKKIKYWNLWINDTDYRYYDEDDFLRALVIARQDKTCIHLKWEEVYVTIEKDYSEVVF